MNYGFVIDNDTCIGCHACSTACKSENQVPLGVNRTWVKYVEAGAFPDVRRNFQVTRCNHCANPPCVRICPVTAMYQRDDGIVEFDPDRCIGCKACLQACPYDAIYVDPDSGTAAKCHYCAHRVDVGLEPACVVVCPEHAIIAGDLDDPASEISRVLARSQVTVRKPEQGTAPKLFYVNGNDTALQPSTTLPETFLWADVISEQGSPVSRGDGAAFERAPRHSPSGERLREPAHQGLPEAGPIMIGEGRMAEQMVQVAYNAQHRIPWHWPVPAYLVTKSIATGLFMLLSLGYGFGLIAFDAPAFLAGGLLALLFTAATTALLVFDLERPERFLRIVFQPQMKSWLARGAFLLLGFTAVAGLWWLLEFLATWYPAVPADLLRPVLLWAGLPLAVGTAVYTAFLFGQAEGRDLWQNPLLPVHLLVQAVFSGAAALLVLNLLMPLPVDVLHLARVAFAAGLVADLLVLLLGEMEMPHASENAARAARMIRSGPFRHAFWWGAVAAGHVVPLALLSFSAPALALAGLLAVAGLYFYEHAFVMAPQKIPNS